MTAGRVFVTGAAGRLAQWIQRAFADREVVAQARATLDLTDAAAVTRAIDEVVPAVIVNCAAFNDVDAAEDRPLEALGVNAFAVRVLARAAARRGARLVHYGTDFVFDGAASTPYDEDAAPAPLGIYGASKLLGEWFALDAPGALVLRVESLFGLPEGWTGPRGSLDAIAEGLRQGRDVPVFTDRVVSPSYMPDIAAATRHLIDADVPGGIYHCVNSGQATWFDVATEVARVLGVTPRLRPVMVDQMTWRAQRPRYCALAPGKLAAAGFAMPTWQDAVRRSITGGSPAAGRP